MVLDYTITILAIIVLLPLLLIVIGLASIDTGFPGIFCQKRIGYLGKSFTIYKLRTYHPKTHTKSKIGCFLRDTKLDELLQLFNIIKGDMSLVGPRPDLPGYYDQLEGENRLILNLKPGLTSDASLEFRNEEKILSLQKDPQKYNDEVLFPQKVKSNLQYYYHLSLANDLRILLKTAKVILMPLTKNTSETRFLA